MTPRHGLVIGKFYPPHAGHRLLVRVAAQTCDSVTVVVMASSVESIPLDTRVRWLREIHAADPNVVITGIEDDVRIDYDDDGVWEQHVSLMRVAASRVSQVAVDAVFTSERYGDQLGRRLGAPHVLVDEARSLVPVSATQVRANPSAFWEHLSPSVRAHLALRVILVGAESTGKTTLAGRLAADLRKRGGAFAHTSWVPEYGREFTIEKLAIARARAVLSASPLPVMEDLQWSTDDFLAVATEQNRLEDRAARDGGPVLVCDTDAFATGLWHKRYVGHTAPRVDELSQNLERRLYLLTHHDDVPFTQDGIRDGKAIRAWMTLEFERKLNAAGCKWHWLRGATPRARFDSALAIIEQELARGSGLAPPLA